MRNGNKIKTNKREIVFSGFSGLISKLVFLATQFFIRTIAIQYIGENLLGLDSTIVSILNVFTLLESGLSSAMVVYLVKPIESRDFYAINGALNTFKVIYRSIGCGYVFLAICFAPFLKGFITGINIGNEIYLYYTILIVNGAATYFLAYRRVLLYADQKMYIQNVIDISCNILFCGLQVISIIIIKSYIFFILLKTLQTILGNTFVYFWCGRSYPYLMKGRINKGFLKRILPDMKNLFAGNIAGYIYSSSDSVIISRFISTVTVTYYSNYYMVFHGLNTLFMSVFSAVIPFIKKSLLMEEDGSLRKKHVFSIYTQISYLLSVLIIVPCGVLIDGFIENWVGGKFLLSKSVTWLMMMDLYICAVQNPTGNFIIAEELFSYSKYPDIVGAVLNITISICLVFRWKLEGILVGTVISRLIQWGVRGTICLSLCLKEKRGEQILYWLTNLYRFAILALSVVICEYAVSFFRIKVYLLDFLAKGIVIEITCVIVILLTFSKSRSQVAINKQIISFIKRIVV